VTKGIRNEKMVMNMQLARTWSETVFELPYLQLPGGTKENHKTQDKIFRLTFKPRLLITTLQHSFFFFYSFDFSVYKFIELPVPRWRTPAFDFIFIRLLNMGTRSLDLAKKRERIEAKIECITSQ
jgi:hypothetical protein